MYQIIIKKKAKKFIDKLGELRNGRCTIPSASFVMKL